MSNSDYYQLLNVTPTAGDDELRQALNRELRHWTHRSNNAPDLGKRQEAERRVAMLGDAEQVLFNPELRSLYNHENGERNEVSAEKHRSAQGTSASPGEKAMDLIEEGYQLLEDGKVAAAVEVAMMATVQSPLNGFAWALLGEAQYRWEEPEEAILAYKRAIKLRPEEAQFHYDLGVVLAEQERLDEARQRYERAAQLKPEEVHFRIVIATVCLRAQQYSEAIEILERCLREDPENQHGQSTLAIAYHEAMMETWWKHEDRYYCTSLQQVQAAQATLEKIRGLKFDDTDLKKKIAETEHLVKSMQEREFEGSWAMVVMLALLFVVPGVLWWWASRRPRYLLNRDLQQVVNRSKVGALAHELAQEFVGGEAGIYRSALPPGLKWCAYALPRFVVWGMILLLAPISFLSLVWSNYGPKYVLGIVGAFIAALLIMSGINGPPVARRQDPTSAQIPPTYTAPRQTQPERFPPKPPEPVNESKPVPATERSIEQPMAALPSPEQSLRDFMRHKFAAESSRDLEAIIAGYASSVDYFDDGRVSSGFIRDDKVKYFSRWPRGSEAISGEVLVHDIGDGAWRVTVPTTFRVESATGEWIRGNAENLFRLSRAGDSWQITAQSVKITGREKGSLSAPSGASDQDVVHFIQEHEQKESNSGMEAILADYAPRVRYYDHGSVGLDFIRKDKIDYFKRWPKRTGSIAGPIVVKSKGSGIFVANYAVTFRVSNDQGEWINGEASNTCEVLSESGRFKIQAQDGKILRREKSPANGHGPAPAVRSEPDFSNGVWTQENQGMEGNEQHLWQNKLRINGNAFTYDMKLTARFVQGLSGPAGYTVQYQGRVIERSPAEIKVKITSAAVTHKVNGSAISQAVLEVEKTAKRRIGLEWRYSPRGADLVDATKTETVFVRSR